MNMPHKSAQAWRWGAIDAFKSEYYPITLPTKGQRYQIGARLGPVPPYAKAWPPERPLWPAGIARKMVDLLLFTPDEIWMVKAKLHPEFKDIAMMEEYARLLPLTPDPYLDEHRHKLLRKFLIYPKHDPQVVDQARAARITVHLFKEGRFFQL